MQKEKNKNLLKYVIIGIGSVVALTVMVITLLFVLNFKAEEAYANGNYHEAKKIYETCNMVLNCEEKILDCEEKIIEENNKRIYQEANKNKQEGMYEKAIELFAGIIEYEDSQYLADECKYALAQECSAVGEVERAIELIDAIKSDLDITPFSDELYLLAGANLCRDGEIEQGMEYFKRISNSEIVGEEVGDIIDTLIAEKEYVKVRGMMEQLEYSDYIDIKNLYQKVKYMRYQPYEGGEGEYETETDISNLENRLSFMYGTWYDHTTGEEIVIDEQFINGKRYGVKTYALDYGFEYASEKIEIFYLDNMGEIYTICHHRMSECDVSTWYLQVMGGRNYQEWYDVEKNTWDGMVVAAKETYEAEQELKRQQAMAGEMKAAVYNQAKKDFTRFYDSVYSLKEQLYMKKNFQAIESVAYSYNAGMNLYEIRFNVSVNENALDILFNTSTTTYTISAGYTESNGRLVQTYYYVN